jgi:DNA-binding NarL/FixJ family response regulator
MGRVHGTLVSLREITDPATILSRAPMELSAGSNLDRVVISMVRDGRMVPETAYFRNDPVGALKTIEELAGDAPRLEYPLIENEILRRNRATIVTDAQANPRVHRAMARAMGWDTFVSAPISTRGEVIGLIHADGNGRSLDVLDADVLWTFAAGLGDVYETASLRRALRRQQTELREFVDWLGTRSSELNRATIEFEANQPSPVDPPGELEVDGTFGGVDDRLVFERVLTRRELEVLRLLVRGSTNGAIADELVISEGTVKFHVSNVLAKLRVANRAEAVARYHRLVRLGSPDADATDR